jgi:outer membrane protein assembly factor BamB
VTKFLKFFLLFVFITNCSLDTKSNIWTKNKKIVKEKQKIIKLLFKDEKPLDTEFNPQLKIKLSGKLINNSFINNFDNNNGRINYNGNLKKISRFKFSKIDNFDESEPEIIFSENNVIFFDNKGSILKFDNSSKLIWKKNYYSKSEKKLKPLLFFANNKDTLIVTDSISKYYAMNIGTGELLWSKNHSAHFNSQVKIYKDKFFAVDSQNVLRCYSVKDGTELWRVKTERALIKSVKKLSLIIIDNKVYFNNSIGDVTAVDIKNGNLLWLTPTQSSEILGQSFFIKSSNLVANNNSIFLSNNRSEFFSLDLKTGILNWKHKINSTLTPTLVDNLIFTITMEGFLVVIENRKGNIIRITDIFKQFKKKKRSKIKPVGFIVGSENIYLTTDHGRLIIIDIALGRTKSILKIDSDKVSRPFVLNQNLYIIKENSIIRLN